MHDVKITQRRKNGCMKSRTASPAFQDTGRAIAITHDQTVCAAVVTFFAGASFLDKMAGTWLWWWRALRIIEMTAGFMPPMPGLLAACTMLEPGFRDKGKKG